MEVKRKTAVLLMLFCAALWSIGGLFIKLIPWNPLVIAGFRSLLAGGVMYIYMLSRGQRLHWTKEAFFSGLLLCGTMLFFVSANKLTTAANAIALQYTAPVFVLIYSSLLFKTKFRKVDVLAVLITLGGMSLFFLGSLSPGNLLGNLMAIAAGMCFGGMMVASDKADADSCMTGLLFGNLLTAAVGVPVALFTKTVFTPSAVLSILALGIFQLGIPYVLYGIATRGCPPLACSLIATVEPLLNPIWVFAFTGEAPSLFALIGMVVVLTAVTGWCILNGKQAENA